ncbi:MAG: hypothetical protein IPK26_31575 [Planctomycetes bacterium]|nr:hypothetical protein [Planctomycetota bacterium]
MAALSAHSVRYLIVGGYAVTYHARPRFTKDLDVWVDPTPENAQRVWAALAAFGAPLRAHGVQEQDLATPGVVYQIGLPPTRVDILTVVEGLQFAACWPRRAVARFADVEVAYLSRADLITNKRAVGRPQDLDDARELERRTEPKK